VNEEGNTVDAKDSDEDDDYDVEMRTNIITCIDEMADALVSEEDNVVEDLDNTEPIDDLYEELGIGERTQPSFSFDDDDQRLRRADGLEILEGEEVVPKMESCSAFENSDDLLKSLDGSSDEEGGISGGWPELQ